MQLVFFTILQDSIIPSVSAPEYLFSSLPHWGFSVADYIKYQSNLNYP